ncbi:MAG: glycoside hydrolase family 44 protein [Candidatus Omnitrophica bacterium]|nr:glycoside hydrolase family 44 protein [Candidatus Omnitrophota bacterium]
MSKLKSKFLLFIFVLSILATFIFRPGENKVVNLNEDDWFVTTDSGWKGASNGQVVSTGNNLWPVELRYRLIATKLWPWPEIDFWLKFRKEHDLSKYSGIKLVITSQQKDEIYVYFMAEDQNLKLLKPLAQKCRLNGKPNQEIFLLFSDFQIPKDWSARVSGFNSVFKWDKTRRLGIHKKGSDKEEGKLLIKQIQLFNNPSSKGKILERTRPPKHYTFDLTLKPGNYDNEIVILDSDHDPVGPYFYGANWGVWLDLPDKDKTAFLELKVIRAGGPFMDRYDWRKSKFTFPGNDRKLNMVSLDEFIKYCRNIGAEPLIQVSALGDNPAENAAELLRYLNQEKGYGVKFFEIGNEPFIWHQVHFDLCDHPCSLAEYFVIFKKISLALRNTQESINPDFKISIFAPGIETAWLDWSTLSGKDGKKPVLGQFLKMCKDFEKDRKLNPKGIRLIDVLSFHLFPSFKGAQPLKGEIDDSLILESAQTWYRPDYLNKYDSSLPLNKPGGVIPRLKDIIKNNYPGIKLALTEFNLESKSMVDYDPLTKVLYLADLYGILARSGVDYFMQFCLNSSDQNTALLDDLDNITPLYHSLALFARNFNGNILEVKNTHPEKLSIYACNKGQDIVIMAINKENFAKKAKVLLKVNDQFNFSLSFPALSLTCVKIDKLNQKAECWEYGKEQIN